MKFSEKVSALSGQVERNTISSILAAILIVVLMVIFWVPSRGAPDTPARSYCQVKLRQLALGLWNYQAAYLTFPPAFTVDQDGNKLHSWRTLILPFIEEESLYETIELRKPWDDPINHAARMSATPDVFRCPSAKLAANHTTYLANVSPSGAFNSNGKRRTEKDFLDGIEQTIALFEVAPEVSIEWMSPEDGDFETFALALNAAERIHKGGLNVAMADGSAHFIRSATDVGKYKPLFTIADGDKADWKK
jgi:prepilin-type processing-associated H-X9-DG protein